MTRNPTLLTLALLAISAPSFAESRVVGDTFKEGKAAHQRQMDEMLDRWNEEYDASQEKREALTGKIRDGQRAHQGTISANTERWTREYREATPAREEMRQKFRDGQRAHQDYIEVQPDRWWGNGSEDEK